MKYLSLLLLVMGAFAHVCAQNPQGGKRANVYADSAVHQLVDRHIEYNKKEKTLEGYRVQIFFDSGNNARKNSNEVRIQFIEKFPEVEAYLTFQQPYFKIRVGNFRTRIEAERFLRQIQTDFPNSFVIKDKIQFPKISL